MLAGMKDDDFGLNSSLLWLRDSDRGLQSPTFQGIGVNPWMQPRFDPSMLNMQTDMYQAAAAAVQEMRGLDPSKQHSASILQFQQPQNFPNRTAAFVQAQMLQQTQHQQIFGNNQENQHSPQSHLQTQAHLPQQLQHQHSFNSQQHQQQQLRQTQQQQQQVVDNQQISSAVSSMSQFVSAPPPQSPPMQAISSLCQPQNFSDSNGNSVPTIVSPLHSILGSFPQDETSHLLNLPRTSSWIPVQNSSGWPSKRVAVDPLLSSGVSQCVLPQVEQLGQPQSTVSQNAITLPPFPGRECSIDQEGSNDPQNHLLFGVNIDPSSLLMPNGMSNLKGVSSNNDSSTLPYQSSNYLNTTTGIDSSLNHGITPSIGGESGYLQSPENAGQGNPLNKTFVKVSFSSRIIFFSIKKIRHYS